MTTMVGLLLLVVFLVFAILMLLERLSALLALPLMAASFLFVAVVADWFQPAEVQHRIAAHESIVSGQSTPQEKTEPVPSRFVRFVAERRRYTALLNEQAKMLGTGIEALQAAADSCSDFDAACTADLRASIVELADRVTAFRSKVRDDLNKQPAPFAKPPDYAGPRDAFFKKLDALPVHATLRPLAEALDEADAGSARSKWTGAMSAAIRQANNEQDAHPPAGAHNARWIDALSYFYHAFALMLQAGSMALAGTIIATLFGGMFAVYVRDLKIAERMVYWTAEFAGEQPRAICFAIYVVTAIIFTSVGGLGTVIMLGTIILPILRSVGLGALLSAGVLLLGIATGGTLHPVSRRLWMDFYGIAPDALDRILWTMVGIYALAAMVWILLGTRRRSLSNFCAVADDNPPDDGESPASPLPRRLMLAPLLPVVLVYFGRVEEIVAFTIGLVFMYLCVCSRPGAARVFARALIEGARTVVPPILLMLGIGILLTSLFTEPVQGYLKPLLSAAVPRSRLAYILTFAIGAPLALYRGPLNVWGMGLAVSATLLAASTLPPTAILGAILAAGMLQSVCDPTNTANVWIAGFLGVTVNQILRATLTVVWPAAAIAVVIFGVQYAG